MFLCCDSIPLFFILFFFLLSEDTGNIGRAVQWQNHTIKSLGIKVNEVTGQMLIKSLNINSMKRIKSILNNLLNFCFDK